MSEIVSYLLEANKLLSANPNFSVIRSNILAKCYSFKTDFLENSVNNVSHCTACGFSFSSKLPSFYLQPGKKCNKFIKKLLKKGGGSTPYQQRRLKKYNKMKHRRVIINTCQSCGKQYKTFIKRPNDLMTTSSYLCDDTEETTIPITQVSKKKKKNRNKFSGLKESVIKKVQQSKNDSVSTNVIAQNNVEDQKNSCKSVKKRKRKSKLNSDSTETLLSKRLKYDSDKSEKQEIRNCDSIIILDDTCNNVINLDDDDVDENSFAAAKNKSLNNFNCFTPSTSNCSTPSTSKLNSGKKSSKKAKKLNSLTRLLNNSTKNVNKITSKLQNFLESVSINN